MTRSKPKVIGALIMCLWILYVCFFHPDDVLILGLTSYPLCVYCLIDIPGNTTDMIIHHFSTIVTTASLHYSYPDKSLELTAKVTNALMCTEVSTIFLNLIHLGYKHIFIKLLFLFTFTYYRIYKIPDLLILNSDTCYFCNNENNYVCNDNVICHIGWSMSTINLMALNVIWYIKILRKIFLNKRQRN